MSIKKYVPLIDKPDHAYYSIHNNDVMREKRYMRYVILLCCIIYAGSSYGKNINQFSYAEQLTIIHALNQEQQYQNVIDIISEIKNPSPYLTLLKGRAHHALHQRDAAISAYKTVLKVKPDANSVRLNLAQALEQSGRLAQSKRHYILLLDELASSNADLYLEQKITSLEQQIANHYIKLHLRSFYDANINKAPNQGNMRMGDYIFNFDDPIAAYMIAPEIEMGYQYKFSPKFQWNSFMKAGLEASVWSDTEIGSMYDRAYVQAATGLSYNMNNKTSISLFAHGGLEMRDYQYDSHYFGTTASLYHQLGKFYIYGKYNYQYQENVLDFLSAQAHKGILGAIYTPNMQEQYGVSISYRDHNAKSNLFSYYAPYISVSWAKSYDNGFDLSTSAWLELAQYEQHSNLFENIREDFSMGGSMSISHKKIQLWGMQPKITYAYEQVDSNQEPYARMNHQIMFDYTYDF